jgi:hypothetical protein
VNLTITCYKYNYDWISLKFCDNCFMFKMSNKKCLRTKIKEHNPLPHEHIIKSGRFHWKVQIAMKLWKMLQYWWNLTVTACSIVNFLLAWQLGDVSKLPKKHYFAFFSSKLISKCCNFSMDCDRVNGFSTLVTRYLTIDLRLFLACHIFKINFAMRGTDTPVKTSKAEGGTPPFWQPLHVHFWLGTPR